jgi:hypothetical protein
MVNGKLAYKRFLIKEQSSLRQEDEHELKVFRQRRASLKVVF